MPESRVSKKLVVKATVVVLLAAAVSSAGATVYVRKRALLASDEHKLPSKHLPETIISLGEPITVNLADADRAAFIKCSLQVGAVPGRKPSETLIPRSRDTVIRVLTAHTSASLSTGEGRQRLKGELLAELRAEGEDEVVSIYFTDFLVQR